MQNLGLICTYVDAILIAKCARRRIPVIVTVRQTGVQGGVPAAIRITNTCKAHLVSVALVDRQLNDRVVCTQVQVRRLNTVVSQHSPCNHICYVSVIRFNASDDVSGR